MAKGFLKRTSTHTWQDLFTACLHSGEPKAYMERRTGWHVWDTHTTLHGALEQVLLCIPASLHDGCRQAAAAAPDAEGQLLYQQPAERQGPSWPGGPAHPEPCQGPQTAFACCSAATCLSGSQPDTPEPPSPAEGRSAHSTLQCGLLLAACLAVTKQVALDIRPSEATEGLTPLQRQGG